MYTLSCHIFTYGVLQGDGQLSGNHLEACLHLFLILIYDYFVPFLGEQFFVPRVLQVNYTCTVNSAWVSQIHWDWQNTNVASK